MKTVSIAAFALTALSVQALPHNVKRATVLDDTVLLNYALTLEHLENAFYSGALAKFDEAAFEAAGLPSFARGRFEQVAAHEAAHVKFLSEALGPNATQPCTYSFPYTDPKSFAALSQTLEGVGVSAYAGAAQYITSKKYLTAAAVILSTEARHASWVASAVNKVAGWSGPLDVALDLNEVYTLAAAFITSCPSTNPALPVKAFPSLKLGSGGPGSTVSVTYSPASSSPAWVAFFTNLSQELAEIKNGKVTIPKDLQGTVYAVVTTNGTAASDDNILAGSAILQINFNSAGKDE